MNTKRTYIKALKLISIFMLIIITAFLRYKITAHAGSVHRGIWISYVDFDDAGLCNKNEADFTRAADKMFAKLEKYGFNNVYFHVRPFDDSIYPSDTFEWCSYLSDKPLGYDALNILIDTAHKHKLSFHAWINPYRITLEKIYNPAKQDTTDRINDGVYEIISNYDVDGIHFDDYFYPSPQKGKQFYKVSEEDRMNNVNNMIGTVYNTIKSYDENILFSISPSGNTMYARSIGCDLETWFTQEGYVDYIIPQLYWSDNYRMDGKKVKYFTQTLGEWCELNTNNIPMYIGLALYKAGIYRSEDPGWRNSFKNIVSQVKLCADYSCDGYVMFSYKYLFTEDGKKETAAYIRYISGLKLTKPAVRIKKGGKFNLNKIISIKKRYKSALKYTSASKQIATINNKGIIKARKKGLTRIIVKGLAGSKVICPVRVTLR